MTQELMDLRICINEGRYEDALMIVDELEGMSKQAILRNIQSYLRILMIHLIKNQIEQRLTNSWASSICNAIEEIEELNLKDNQKSYYVNAQEWEDILEEKVLERALTKAREEVLGGKLSRSELVQRLDREQLIKIALELLNLTYNNSSKTLPLALDEYLGTLPGGEAWGIKSQ